MQAFEALLESAIATPAEDSSSLSRSSSRKTKAASAATGHAFRIPRNMACIWSIVSDCSEVQLNGNC